MSLLAIDHVQIAIPPGGEDAARAFYGDLLGLTEVPKPASMAGRGGCWFERGDIKVHLGVEAPFRPNVKAHVAFRVDDVPSVIERALANGRQIKRDDPLEGVERVFIFDPFGNRLEFLAPVSPFPLEGGRAGDGGDALTGKPRDRPAPRGVDRARRLRRDMTVAERLLWSELRKLDINIRRQAPIGRFIADFVHHSSRLVIEVDGPVHDEAEAQQKDAERTAWLNAQGYRVVRLPESQVRNQLEQVVEQIAAEVSSAPVKVSEPRYDIR